MASTASPRQRRVLLRWLRQRARDSVESSLACGCVVCFQVCDRVEYFLARGCVEYCDVEFATVPITSWPAVASGTAPPGLRPRRRPEPAETRDLLPRIDGDGPRIC